MSMKNWPPNMGCGADDRACGEFIKIEKPTGRLLRREKAELSVMFPESPHLPADLAARSVFHLPYTILKDTISDVVLLIEDEILDGIRMALTTTHNLAEGAAPFL